MDQRQTFATNQELLAILDNLYLHEQSASLLVDSEGLSRVDGLITTIDRKLQYDDTVFIIGNKHEFKLRQVVAVNGIFRSDYSEC